MKLTRQRDDFHWTCNRLLSYNKTYNFAVSGRGTGKTTDISRYMMKQHEQGYSIVVIKRQIADINETTIEDFQNAYNILQDDEHKITLHAKFSGKNTGNTNVYIDGDEQPFFRMIALSNPKRRLKGLAFDRPLTLIVFDEYKISGSEKYIKDEYGKFQELYGTLARFGKPVKNDPEKTVPPRVIFLGNNYSLTDPYIANMKIPVREIAPGKVLTKDGAPWAFEDILINDKLREYLLAQNPLFKTGDDAYMKYALEGESVSDQRIRTIEQQPDNFKLLYVLYIEGKYLGVFWNTKEGKQLDEPTFWVSVLENYNTKRRDITCFDFDSLIDGTYLMSRSDSARFSVLKNAFRWREIAFKSIYEGYLFEQIYELI